MGSLQTNSLILFNIAVPAPVSVSVTSDPVSPIQPVGSAVALTCTVELSPAVVTLANLTVTTVWTGPAGFNATNTAQPVMGNTTTYISTAMVSSFGRNDSGYYSCKSNITSNSLASRSINDKVRLTVGKSNCCAYMITTKYYIIQY